MCCNVRVEKSGWSQFSCCSPFTFSSCSSSSSSIRTHACWQGPVRNIKRNFHWMQEQTFMPMFIQTHIQRNACMQIKRQIYKRKKQEKQIAMSCTKIDIYEWNSQNALVYIYHTHSLTSNSATLTLICALGHHHRKGNLIDSYTTAVWMCIAQNDSSGVELFIISLIRYRYQIFLGLPNATNTNPSYCVHALCN